MRVDETSEARRGALPSGVVVSSCADDPGPGRKRPRISTDDCGLSLSPPPPTDRGRVLYRVCTAAAVPCVARVQGVRSAAGKQLFLKRVRLNPGNSLPNRICFESCHGPRANETK